MSAKNTNYPPYGPLVINLKNLMMDNARLYATVNSRHDELLFIVRYLNLRHRSLAGGITANGPDVQYKVGNLSARRGDYRGAS